MYAESSGSAVLIRTHKLLFNPTFYYACLRRNYIFEILYLVSRKKKDIAVLRIRVRHPGSGIQDPASRIRHPGSGAFFTPGSGIGFFRISGPRSRIPNLNFRELSANFWIKSTIILCQLAKIFFCTPVQKKVFLFSDICCLQKVRQQIFLPLLLLFFRSDPGWIKKNRIRD
jgi:hypothetical protein